MRLPWHWPPKSRSPPPESRRLVMAVYLVERNLSGIRVEQLVATQMAAIRTSEKFTRAGIPVRYIRSTYVPADGRCACLFEAPDPATVRQVNDAAGLSYIGVVEALDLTPINK